jgi:hypothetical protein
MLAELTICWSLECEPKCEARMRVEVVCADRFEEFERERRRGEEYERIFRLLLEEVQRQD